MKPCGYRILSKVDLNGEIYKLKKNISIFQGETWIRADTNGKFIAWHSKRLSGNWYFTICELSLNILSVGMPWPKCEYHLLTRKLVCIKEYEAEQMRSYSIAYI